MASREKFKLNLPLYIYCEKKSYYYCYSIFKCFYARIKFHEFSEGGGGRGGGGEGRGENKWALKFYILFGDCGWEVQMYKKKKFFINNSFEAVIPFKEKYQGLLKLHLSLRGVSSGVGKK